MGATLLANDSEGEPLEDDDAVFSRKYGFFEDMKGFMIRAAIAYLKDLQSKPLTKKRLINKGMLGSAHIDAEPEVVVGIYEDSIQEGINLLTTWVREPDPTAPRFDPSIECLLKHVWNAALFAGYPHDSWTDDQNGNYHLSQIQKGNVPLVLKRLRMAGLWRYARGSWRQLKPHHCQEIVAFLDRVMRFFRRQFDPPYLGYKAREFVPEVKEFRRVFELCPEDGTVVLK